MSPRSSVLKMWNIQKTQSDCNSQCKTKENQMEFWQYEWTSIKSWSALVKPVIHSSDICNRRRDVPRSSCQSTSFSEVGQSSFLLSLFASNDNFSAWKDFLHKKNKEIINLRLPWLLEILSWVVCQRLLTKIPLQPLYLVILEVLIACCLVAKVFRMLEFCYSR